MSESDGDSYFSGDDQANLLVNEFTKKCLSSLTIVACPDRSLFPDGDEMVCIVDDRADVWQYADNVVQVLPYNFFKATGDINAPPGFEDKQEHTEDSPPISGVYLCNKNQLF